MCIIALALKAHEDFPFILAHNRDEACDRPTEPPRVHPGLQLFSRDLVAGGTFLGLELRSLAFGAITNVRSTAARPAGSRSRGDLIPAVLSGRTIAELTATDYTAFNLWHGTVQPPKAVHSRSWPDEAEPSGWRYAQSRLPEGEVVALSNEPVSDLHPGDWEWPKTRFMRIRVAQLLQSLPDGASAETVRDALGALLSTQLDLSESELRTQLSSSPLPRWREHALQEGPLVSKIRHAALAQAHGEPDTEAYGTLCQTVLVSCARTRTVYFFYRHMRDDEPENWQVWAQAWSPCGTFEWDVLGGQSCAAVGDVGEQGPKENPACGRATGSQHVTRG